MIHSTPTLETDSSLDDFLKWFKQNRTPSLEVARSIEHCICPTCGHSIDLTNEFRNRISHKEFTISGLCQACQDSVFGED